MSIYRYFLENNMNMRYNEIFTFPILVVLSILLVIVFFRSSLDIILYSNINNKDICIKVNIKYMFNLVNINRQLYPPNKNKKNKMNRNKKKGDILNKNKILFFKDILSIYKLLKKIRVYEFYSDIKFGNKIIEFTSFIYFLINIIYGNLLNLIKPEKVYLKVNPNYTEDYIYGDIKMHIKPTIKDLIYITIGAYKIYKKNRGNNKEGDSNESNRVNTKSYGNNS